jgi:hypothetical protein
MEVAVASQKRLDVWNALLDAEMNDCYWSDEARRYGSRDRWLAATTALLSSGTVVALFNFSAYPTSGKILACFATVVSIVHATFFHTGRLKQVSGLAARWKELAIEYGLLWAEVEDGGNVTDKAWKEFETISRREKSIDESAFSINKRRLEMAQQHVMKARSL